MALYARTNICYNERGSRTSYISSSIHHCVCNLYFHNAERKVSRQ